MEGYKRSTERTEELLGLLSEALHKHPEQRLGQLLENLARGLRTWVVHDEEWIKLLKLYLENEGNR